MINDPSFPLADIPDALQWSEGMLLSPQHLQQSDVYWHDQARGRMATLEPDYWGLLSLSIDTAAWASGVLKLSQVSAVLPDGVPVSYPLDKEERLLSLDLKAEKLLPADGRPLRIWFGAPHRSGDSARQDSYLPRHSSCVGEMAVDENTGNNPVGVSRLRINLVLITDEAQLSRHSAFPLMEVVRNSDGHIVLGEYQPPMLRVGASGFLGDAGLTKQLQALSQKVWSKLRELAEHCDEDGEASSGARYLGLARQLAAALPQFDVLACSPNTHPSRAYHALSLLVGNSVGLGANPLPPLLAPYRHQECAEQFREAIAYVQRRLDGVDTSMEKLPFRPLGEKGFIRLLEMDSPTDELIIELKPRGEQEFGELSQWLDMARIASDDLMTVLRQRRLRGAKVRPLTHEERSRLGLNESAMLFLLRNQPIEVDGQQVSAFRPGRSLLIAGLPDGVMPAGVLLYRFKKGQPKLDLQDEITPVRQDLDAMAVTHD